MKQLSILLVGLSALLPGAYAGRDHAGPWTRGGLKVSANGRFLQFENGEPFFWLADTGWLLFQRLDRAEAEVYLEDRRQKGFNVIQAMILHELPETNIYGAGAVAGNDPAQPGVPGGEHEYWEHVDFVVDLAARKGIFMAMVPVWGGIVKAGQLSVNDAKAYARFLAERYGDRPNVVWINGGDIQGDNHPEVWKALGGTLHTLDPNHLMTFHPFGRTRSAQWFHTEPWLDFNMFQSGHRRYGQIDPGGDPAQWKGEDNWRYVLEDYALTPARPTLDGEPSYENIPQGLHDPNEPYWQAGDARRYAYWSVFAGACGHTYGDNAVMQMHKPGSKGAYGVRNTWLEAIHDPGAGQMRYLKALILSRPYFERVPDPSVIAGDPGERYDRLLATRGRGYAFVYTYTGRSFDVAMGRISGTKVKARWYNPRNGEAVLAGEFENRGIRHFDPPGEPGPGNDWVLILDDADESFPVPGNIFHIQYSVVTEPVRNLCVPDRNH